MFGHSLCFLRPTRHPGLTSGDGDNLRRASDPRVVNAAWHSINLIEPFGLSENRRCRAARRECNRYDMQSEENRLRKYTSRLDAVASNPVETVKVVSSESSRTRSSGSAGYCFHQICPTATSWRRALPLSLASYPGERVRKRYGERTRQPRSRTRITVIHL